MLVIDWDIIGVAVGVVGVESIYVGQKNVKHGNELRNVLQGAVQRGVGEMHISLEGVKPGSC